MHIVVVKSHTFEESCCKQARHVYNLRKQQIDGFCMVKGA